MCQVYAGSYFQSISESEESNQAVEVSLFNQLWLNKVTEILILNDLNCIVLLKNHFVLLVYI